MKKLKLFLLASISLLVFSFVGCEARAMTMTPAATLHFAVRKPKITPTPVPKPKKKKVTPTPTPKSNKKAKPTPIPIPKAKPTPVPQKKDTAPYNSILSTDFENGSSGFTGRGGAELVEVTGTEYYKGKYSIKVSNRTAAWHGAEIDLTETLKPGNSYKVSAWVKYTSGPSTLQIDCKINKNDGQNYLSFGSANATKSNWTKLEGTIKLPEDTTSAKFYFEAASAVDDFYIDNVELSEEISQSPTTDGKKTDDTKDISSIANIYKEYFTIGAATSDFVLNSDFTQPIVLQQFNAITMENECKPYNLLDYSSNTSNPDKYNLSPAISLYKLDKYLKFAKEHNLKVRFHTLVWHSQTPDWFFKENYSTSPSAKLASKEVMLQRMENYIKQIMQYTKSYPGVIYAWDVVNEAMEPSHGKPNGYRANDSLWYKIVGEEFVEKAFEYARKYSYDEAGLFYNDYNTYISIKRTAIYNMAKLLKEKDLIDGIGMQSHIDMGYPTLSEYEATIKKYSELGLEINITELDMHNNQNTPDALKRQAERYGDLFKILVKLDNEGTANITNVTFWGVLDSQTWLTRHRRETSYPLLFDKNGNPKPCYYEIINVLK